MKFEWDDRKARRNEREHYVSFGLARQALESGLGFHAGDQLYGGEWRLVIIAPVRGIALLTIVITLRNEDQDANGTKIEEDGGDEAGEGGWNEGNSVVRIISARKATAKEQHHYFENRSSAEE
jgi:uncharacterized DUF497 family protein